MRKYDVHLFQAYEKVPKRPFKSENFDKNSNLDPLDTFLKEKIETDKLKAQAQLLEAQANLMKEERKQIKTEKKKELEA